MTSDGMATTVRTTGDVEITVRLTRREADELLRDRELDRFDEGWVSQAFTRRVADQKVRDAIDAAYRA